MPIPSPAIVGRIRRRSASERRFVRIAFAPSSERDLLAIAISLRNGATCSARLARAMPYLGIARRARGLLQRSERTTDGSTIGSADFVRYCLSNYPISHSQILQDLFVMFWLGEPDRGYAVEFGVADGVSLSNTYLLEQRGWDTLVAEPARSAQASIRRHRGRRSTFAACGVGPGSSSSSSRLRAVTSRRSRTSWIATTIRRSERGPGVRGTSSRPSRC